MRAYDVIMKKRDRKSITKEEIEFFIGEYAKDQIPDYQASALAMAIYLNGFDARETADLTMAMVNSGDTIDLSGITGTKADKHSTGGVGDTTTLVLAPWVAACGAPVAKMSGRGLGHTGGTIDKLESIPGFSTALDAHGFINAVNDIKVAVIAQTANLVPADKKLYALRDVTATIESIPLIAGSIMSKKIAAGADAIVLDVKTGSGAFMKTRQEALRLARAMVDIGTMVGRRTAAVITSMEQPLGYAVGNSLEVIEAIDTLKGKGPQDLHELCLVLGAHMLVLAGVVHDVAAGRRCMTEALKDGSALNKFREMVANQHGNPDVTEKYELLPEAGHVIHVKAVSSGNVQAIDAQEIGLTAMILGAGREKKEDTIDHAAGIVLCKKTGDRVESGETLAVLHTNKPSAIDEAKRRVLGAYKTSMQKPKAPPLVYGIVTDKGEEFWNSI